jgi:predicted nucleic acid-binding protein
MVLPDTSVWVDFSRRGAKGRAAELHDLLDAGEVATCGSVVSELLGGAGGEVEEKVWETLSSLPWAELTPSAWREVAAAGRRLRQSGQTLPLTDLAIAVAAARADHVLWTFDADFDRIRTVVSGLKLHRSALAS